MKHSTAPLILNQAQKTLSFDLNSTQSLSEHLRKTLHLTVQPAPTTLATPLKASNVNRSAVLTKEQFRNALTQMLQDDRFITSVYEEYLKETNPQ